MERTKRERSKFRAQYIPLEEMFSEHELTDLKHAFDAVSQGEAFVNMLSLKTLFAEMGIFPSDEMLGELLNSCGRQGNSIDAISFDLFARSVALLLEENLDKVSTSSKDELSQREGVDMSGDRGHRQDEEDEDMGEDPYYNEYDVGEQI